MKTDKPFTLKARLGSFGYAFRGIVDFFREEHNAILHVIATLMVIGMAVVFGVSRVEAILLVIVAGLVWMAELFNTAIEKMMDYISTEKQTQIKLIKDLSAAAVLISSVIAVATGAIIFIPKL